MGLFKKKKEKEAARLLEEQKNNTSARLAVGNFSDPAEDYANNRPGQGLLQVQHLASQTQVNFMAFITDFGDKFTSDWNTEQVYGRMDPIATFRGTTRVIAVGWTLPASSVAQGYENLIKCQKLVRMLYPNYSSAFNVNTIEQSPLVRVKFSNLISKGLGSDIEDGLLGYIGGITFSPVIDDGFFDQSRPEGQASTSTYSGHDSVTGYLAPKTIKLSFSLTVLHEKPLGWGGTDYWLDRSNDSWFPYQMNLNQPSAFDDLAAQDSLAAQADSESTAESDEANAREEGILNG